MKNLKNPAVFFYIAAACFYIAAVFGFIYDKSYAVTYLCLGSAFLCLGSMNIIKEKKEKAAEDNDTEKGEDK